MTVVYLDTLLLVNFMANYLALRAAASLAVLPIRRGLLALSALLGAVYAGAVFLPGMTWLARWPCKAAAGAVMVVVAFGGCGRLLRAGVTFFLTAAALGGLVLAAELLGGRQLVLENGVLYAHVDLRLLLLLLLGSYLVLEMALRRVWSGRDRHCGEAEVRLPGGTARLRVLLDTGNTLTDPLTNRPVLVAEGAALERVLPRNFPWWDPVRGVEQAAVQGLRGVRLLPYRAVGVDCGMLLAVKSQGITLEGRDLGPLLVALSPTPVSDGGNYQALLGAE